MCDSKRSKANFTSQTFDPGACKRLSLLALSLAHQESSKVFGCHDGVEAHHRHESSQEGTQHDLERREPTEKGCDSIKMRNSTAVTYIELCATSLIVLCCIT